MATATVYTVSYATGEVIEQFDCDYNFAIGEYHGKRNLKGKYYIAKKGVKIPYPFKEKILLDVRHQSDQEQSL
jgi:hypothetical protein